MPRILPQYKEEVKKKIVETAYQLFLTKGYRGTTMDEIAAALGVTKPALYQYFPGKEDLFAAVAGRSRQQLAGILERSYRNRDIRGGSEALFDALSLFAPRYFGMFAEMTLMAPSNDRVRRILEEDLHGDILMIEQFISRQQESGLVSSMHDTHALAVASHAVINGLLFDIAMGMDIKEARKIWITTVDALTRAH